MQFMLKGDSCQNAQLLTEEFFPIIAVFSDKIEDIAHIGFYYQDTDLLEFAIDRKSGLIRSLTLTLCKHYKLFDETLRICDAPVEAPIPLDLPTKVECGYFNLEVYRDGIVAKLSEGDPVSKICAANIVFLLGPCEDIIGIAVTALSPNVISHCINELEFMK